MPEFRYVIVACRASRIAGDAANHNRASRIAGDAANHNRVSRIARRMRPTERDSFMIVAYHSIFCAYGFWLPNDPRGSWSDFVGAWELFIAGGPATACGARRSLAGQAHDRAAREAGKAALAHPPMRFNLRQTLSIANGLAVACAEADFRVLACAILPDHVHIVTRRHPRNIEMVVGHLRSRATKQLGLDGLRPAQPIWAKKSWNRYLDPPDVPGAIAYVNANPRCAGIPPQAWPFVESPG